VSNLVKRLLFAAVAIPVALGIVWYGGLALALLVMAAAGLGVREVFDLAERTGVRPLRGLGITLAMVAPLSTWMLTGGVPDVALGINAPAVPILGALIRSLADAPLWLFSQWPLAAVLAPILILAGTLWRRGPADRPLAAAAVTLLAPIYCGLLPSTLLLIRYGAGESGSWAATWLVFYPLVITWLCDSFAMWGGTLIGGPKLSPVVSPGKTRSGAVAGVLGGVIAALVYVPLALAPVHRALPIVQALALGLILSVTAQIGDLAESLLKREAGVKDSSGLIPGHGGVLDRLDSLYFVLPICALLYRAFGVI
jgi:phosphatidate cytidylyltransferase